MNPAVLTSLRELDARVNDGIHVRLLWCEHDGRLWVSVLDTKSREAFCLEVAGNDRPRDVFHHPFAYPADRPLARAAPTGSAPTSVAA